MWNRPAEAGGEDLEMAMDAEVQSTEVEVTISNGVLERPGEVSLGRAAAAGSLVLSAALLMAGKRKSAVAAAAVAGAIAVMEEPELVKRLWDNIPKYLRRGQDFLVKVEDMVSEVTAQGEKLRETLKRED